MNDERNIIDAYEENTEKTSAKKQWHAPELLVLSTSATEFGPPAVADGGGAYS